MMKRYSMKTAISLALLLLVLGASFAVHEWRNRDAKSPDFTQYQAGPERKKVFFDYFLPIILERNREIRELRDHIKEMRADKDDLSWWDRRKLKSLAEQYRLGEPELGKSRYWKTLLRRVDVIPPSLALAQAANESAWGTSRFARKGDNFFGQWCFRKGCGLVPSRRHADKKHEVAVFDSPKDSVERYIRNLNSHPAYRRLRDIREELRSENKPVTGIALTRGLLSYSERGEDYIRELRAMIRQNELSRHDKKI